MISWRTALVLGLVSVLAPTITAYEFQLIHERLVESAVQFADLDPLVGTSGELEGFVYTDEANHVVILDLLSSSTLRIAEVDGRMLSSACATVGDTIRVFTAYSTWTEPYPQLAVIDFLSDTTTIRHVMLGVSNDGPCNAWMMGAIRANILDFLDEEPALSVSFDYSVYCDLMCCQPSSYWEYSTSTTLVYDLEVNSRLWYESADQIVAGDISSSDGIEVASIHNYASQYSMGDDPNYSYSRSSMVRLYYSDTTRFFRCSGNYRSSYTILTGDLAPEYDGEEFFYCGTCPDLVPESCPVTGGTPSVCYRIDDGELVPVWCRRDISHPSYVYDAEHLLLSLLSSSLVVLVDGATGVSIDTVEISRPVGQRTFFETEGDMLNLIGRSSDTILVYQLNTSPTAVDEAANSALPEEFVLLQNYPNPFNPTTRIGFQLTESGHVMLRVYNVLGQRVAILVDRPMKAGDHLVEWNATDIASGVYYYRLTVGGITDTRKMLLLK